MFPLRSDQQIDPYMITQVTLYTQMWTTLPVNIFGIFFSKALGILYKTRHKALYNGHKTINQTSLPVDFLWHFSWFSSTFSPWWHNVYSLLAAVCWCPRNWRWVPDITKLSGSLTIRPTHPRGKQNKNIHKTCSIHLCRSLFNKIKQ